jgi:succinate dehydrogenase hydrophobic anchor subunit
MRLTLKTQESTKALAISAAGLFAFEIFYFFVALPFNEIRFPVLFLISYVAWGVIGAVVILREDISARNKAKRALQVFVAMIFGSFIVAYFLPYSLTFLLAFAGFYFGSALAGCAILIYRVKYPNRPQAPRDYKW